MDRNVYQAVITDSNGKESTFYTEAATFLGALDNLKDKLKGKFSWEMPKELVLEKVTGKFVKGAR